MNFSGMIDSVQSSTLSGLYNLNYFMNYVRLYDRHYTEMLMDVVVIDVNNFHILNERYVFPDLSFPWHGFTSPSTTAPVPMQAIIASAKKKQKNEIIIDPHKTLSDHPGGAASDCRRPSRIDHWLFLLPFLLPEHLDDLAFRLLFPL